MAEDYDYDESINYPSEPEMRDRHFVDANGNHFVVPMAPDDYERTDGAVPIADPPSADHRWQNGTWVIPKRPVSTDILTAPAMGFGGPTAKELFNGNR